MSKFSDLIEELKALEGKATPGIMISEISGSPGYFVTSDGRVLSTVRKWTSGRRELHQFINRYGYSVVWIVSNGRRRTQRVHRLVAEAFLSKQPGKNMVCHWDGDKRNNQLANLRWGTGKDNAADRERHGRTARGNRNGARTVQGRINIGEASRMWHQTTPERQVRGERVGLSKLTWRDVLNIRERRRNGEMLRVIAKDCGIGTSSVYDIVKRRTWRHVMDSQPALHEEK